MNKQELKEVLVMALGLAPLKYRDWDAMSGAEAVQALIQSIDTEEDKHIPDFISKQQQGAGVVEDKDNKECSCSVCECTFWPTNRICGECLVDMGKAQGRKEAEAYCGDMEGAVMKERLETERWKDKFKELQKQLDDKRGVRNRRWIWKLANPK